MTTTVVDRYRMLARAGQTEKTPVRAEVPAGKTADGVVTLRLYDVIDSWGGPFGVSAKEFAAVLDELPADTTEIHLHINSPGGEVWDGLAILNMLRQHKAKVVTIVDGIAASAASIVAMAGDEVVMSPNSELMVHLAWGLCVGNADDMTKMADDLNHESDNLAGVYANKAGGTTEQWRAVMADETWFSAEEAVTANLADRVLEGDPAEATKAKARFDLGVFAHAGRAQAPAPKTPAAAAVGSAPAGGTTTEEEVGMSDNLLEGLREQLGLPADADEATVLAKNQEVLAQLQELNDQDPPAPTVAPEALAEISRLSGELAELKAVSAKRQKDEMFASWLRDGKTSPEELKTLEPAYDAAPAQTAALVNARARGSIVPVAEIGSGGTAELDSYDAEIAALEARISRPTQEV